MTDTFDFDIDLPTEDDIKYEFRGRTYQDIEDAKMAKDQMRKKVIADVAKEALIQSFGPQSPDKVVNLFEENGEGLDFEDVAIEILEEADLELDESPRIVAGEFVRILGTKIISGDMSIEKREEESSSNNKELRH